MNNTAIVALAIGEQHLAYWRKYCEASWRAYAQKCAYDLWMGVPVITCPGPTFAGRHSISHLTSAGYGQFVADDIPSYIELAVQWANQLDELATLRSQIRAQVRQSPLCDAPRFARDFLAILTEAREALSRNNGVQKRMI